MTWKQSAEYRRTYSQQAQAKKLAKMTPEEREKRLANARHRQWLKTLTPEQRKEYDYNLRRKNAQKYKERSRQQRAASPAVKIDDSVAVAEARAVDPDPSSCAALISTVINRAVADLFDASAKPSKRDREESLRLLTDEHGEWADHRNELCACLGLDGDDLRHRTLERIKRERPELLENSTAREAHTAAKRTGQVSMEGRREEPRVVHAA